MERTLFGRQPAHTYRRKKGGWKTLAAFRASNRSCE
jgi:hypothetical protein